MSAVASVAAQYEYIPQTHTGTRSLSLTHIRIHKAYLIYCFVHIVLTLKITLGITAPDE